MSSGSRTHAGCLAIVACLASVGCEPPPQVLRLDVTPGIESGDFVLDPAVTHFVIEARDHTGATVATNEAAPGSSFTLGQLPVTTLMTFEVTGRDSEQQVRVRGRSLAVLPSALNTDILPVFAQRLDRFSRPPDVLPEAMGNIRLIAAGSRHLMLVPVSTDGAPRAWFYDLLALSFTGPLALPHAVRSFATDPLGKVVLIIGDEAASWVDFALGTIEAATLPGGLGGWSSVAGGDTVQGPGRQYVVAGTRSGDPSDTVLVVGADRSLEVARLRTARSGAAAAWLDGQGLVVAGGHATEAGVELLRADVTEASSLPFAADATTGASLVPTPTPGRMILLGGQDGNGPAATRELAIDCLARCQAIVVEPHIEVPITDSRAFQLSAGRVLLSGHDTQGLRQSFEVFIGDRVEERPLREDRIGSDIAAGPNGSLFVAGGQTLNGQPVLHIERLWVESAPD